MPTQTQAQQERLTELLDFKVLPPPGDFTARATVTDLGVYEQAAADVPAWWAGEARRRLDWQTPFQAVLDDSNAPFCTWFADGALNASYNCLDRHVNAGHGERVAFMARRAGRTPFPDVRRDPRRHLLRDIADGRELGDVTTLNDPAVLATLQKAAADESER